MNYLTRFLITIMLLSIFCPSQVVGKDNSTDCIEESTKKYSYGVKYYYKNTCEYAVIFAYCAKGKSSLEGECGESFKRTKKTDIWNQYYTHSTVLKTNGVRSYMNSPLEYSAC